jgi:GT2 family glycosyltransferase
VSGGASAATIGVAISTRNRPQALRRCLDSLRAGTSRPAEVVVADQSEDETTRQVVDEVGDGLPIRYIRSRPGGLGAAQNDAVAATTSPVVAVIDDDCVADEGWLTEIGRAFDVDRGLALLAGRVLPLEAHGPNLYAVSSRVSEERREFTGKAMPWDVGSGNNFALRRDWFDRIGGCNEQLGPGAPLRGGLDMDLFYRLLRAGGRARYEPALIVLHERATRAARLDRRSAYGFGMAAAIALWLRGGDLYALKVLGRWLTLRTSLLVRAFGRRRWQAVHEEALVLGGTLQGLARGLRVQRGKRPLP